jgi:hypothetical protein
VKPYDENGCVTLKIDVMKTTMIGIPMEFAGIFRDLC